MSVVSRFLSVSLFVNCSDIGRLQSAGIIPVSADLLMMWFRGPQRMSSRVLLTLEDLTSVLIDLCGKIWYQ